MAAEDSFELAPVRDPSQASRHAMPPDEAEELYVVDPKVHRRTLLKLDCLLLPFLALLFLFNALDKSNIGNAESAHFTTDIGLEKSDLNTAVALFFAFFVILQPLGAALGRKYGMVAWVPSSMLLWGVCTALHAYIRHRWQLYTLRILIGCLEAGFYPVTATYLSLFYTRFEFGRRLSLFYGQAAIGGALGGFISYVVFSRFHDEGKTVKEDNGWRPWQVLFLLEGCLTIAVACAGFFWLPHRVDTAWFLTLEERQYASARIIRDRDVRTASETAQLKDDDEEDYDDESYGLLNSSKPPSSSRLRATLEDRGITPRDIFSAVFNTKIWHILACNILSAVPVYAFSIFLPLVLAPLTNNANPALTNLLAAPPHLCGAVILFVAAQYSDKYHIRLGPVLFGLAIVVIGLTFVVVLPTEWTIPRYFALVVLLSGTYIASPLTVAWISGNTPSPGKRALLLGINGWGNFAGVLAALLFRPSYAASGYKVPFCWTLGSVLLSALGFYLFQNKLRAENERRKRYMENWTEEDVQIESEPGNVPSCRDVRWTKGMLGMTRRHRKLAWMTKWLEEATLGGREGDEKLTFIYGL